MLDRLAAFADKYDMFPPEGLILAAVSGGADSMCLLAALHELSEKRGFTVAAAHFNHRLRAAESDRDARFVETYCLEKNIRLYSGSGDVGAFARSEGLGIEDAARRMRYDFFYQTAKTIDAKRIATAHTADDNAETILLNLTRGAGLNGLGGIPPVRDIIIRPMLTVTRSDVISFLSQWDVLFVEDSSNTLDIYSRNLIRHHVIPVLKELNPRLAEHISVTTSLLRDDETYLNDIAAAFVHDHCEHLQTGVCSLDARALSLLARPISSRVIRLVYGNNLSASHIAEVLELCASDNVSGEIALPSGTAFREYQQIVFSHEIQFESFAPVEVMIGCKVDIPELGLTVRCQNAVYSDNVLEKINKSFTTFLFKYDNICGKIVIRPRETGDKIDLLGRNGSKTLKKLFIERRIPRRSRSHIPVIADSGGILAVCGIGLDKRAACQAGDRALEIIFEETSYEK